MFSNFLFRIKSRDLHGPHKSDNDLGTDMERGLKEKILETPKVRLQLCILTATSDNCTYGNLANVNILF